MSHSLYKDEIQDFLRATLKKSCDNKQGAPASYIPELEHVDPDLVSACIFLNKGPCILAGDYSHHTFTLQSVSKLITLCGLLEEFGRKQVMNWIGAEASGGSFASIRSLARFDCVPSNPLVNAGAIACCSHIPGVDTDAKRKWLQGWMSKLIGVNLASNQAVFESEYANAAMNRSLAYLMKSHGTICGDVEDILSLYIYQCSLETDVAHLAKLPQILANNGIDTNGERILSEETVKTVVAIMTTCGLYNESGYHLVEVGLPAKSGVSGVIVAVITGVGGIAIASPRINDKGTSVRAHDILVALSHHYRWHFALS